MHKLIGNDSWPARLAFEWSMPRLATGGIEFIRQWIESKPHARLVIIDTLAKVRDPRGAQESSYEANYASVSALKALAEEKAVAIVLIHHVRKMESDDPLDTVSGTTGLTGAVDTVLVLKRDGQGFTLYGAGRDIPEVEDAAEFDRERCIWRIAGRAEEVHRSEERSSIIAILREADGPLSPREIADLSSQSYEAVRAMLTRIHKAGEIKKSGRAQYECASQPPCHNRHNITNSEEQEGEDD